MTTIQTINFHKSKCGVDLLLNIGSFKDFNSNFTSDVFNTDFFEIIFFRKANGKLIIGTETIDITDNQIVFISPYEKQQWLVNPINIEAEILIFQEDFLNDFFADKFFSYRLLFFYQTQFPAFIESQPLIIDKFTEYSTEIKSELLNSEFDSAHIIRSLLYYTLTKLNRMYATKYNLSTQTPLSNFAYQYKMLLEKNIKTKQRIEEYTELIGVSRISLNKAVKAQFNITASQLLKQRLLYELKNELLYTNQTISEIADKLNFSESQHLIRFFKQQTGITPAHYRSTEGQIPS